MLRSIMLAFGSMSILICVARLSHAEEPKSLMQMIAEWQYPDSKMDGVTMSDAATMNDAGARTIQKRQLPLSVVAQNQRPKLILRGHTT
jgi:hypothetical protein